jgi:hypothetical protein
LRTYQEIEGHKGKKRVNNVNTERNRIEIL